MDYWSVGVLCLFRIAPAQRVGDAFRTHSLASLPRAKAGAKAWLKPWAVLLDHFMVKVPLVLGVLSESFPIGSRSGDRHPIP